MNFDPFKRERGRLKKEFNDLRGLNLQKDFDTLQDLRPSEQLEPLLGSLGDLGGLGGLGSLRAPDMPDRLTELEFPELDDLLPSWEVVSGDKDDKKEEPDTVRGVSEEAWEPEDFVESDSLSDLAGIDTAAVWRRWKAQRQGLRKWGRRGLAKRMHERQRRDRGVGGGGPGDRGVGGTDVEGIETTLPSIRELSPGTY